MFDFDNFREIFSTIKKNKLRTFLTGFSVSWGIFMLIVLLGAGNGLRNGVMYNFRNMAMNKIEVWPRFTSKPYKGLQSNRQISFQGRRLCGSLTANTLKWTLNRPPSIMETRCFTGRSLTTVT
jgi:putative ABC transport system permease protein